ncbi:hypothetical protein D0Y65_004504 [Glycine soja]|uniref:Replication protein A 70 kDa DNA-binding subunit B/D first OB fold domain-containing protein n=1 Tax=Glycine soja TaxID=3848 RepID=A0A445LRI3_GLYSO|nr:hypothetical protein D0Y65_004504 [Glycine soja]
MARRRDFIRDIDNTKDTLMLVVRIIDLWFVQTKDKYEQAEMIIMDENVVLFNFLMLLIDIIHVLIRKKELKTWKSTLKENNTYMTHNFKIINNKGQYKICLHPYKLIFNDVTVVIEKDLPNIPLKAYDFINFVDICGGTYGRDLLDVNITSAANVTAQVNSIPMLNGTNFKVWKEAVEIVLGCMDLDLALRTEQLISTPETFNEVKVEKWDRSNQMCLMIMKRSIPEAFRGSISEGQSAKKFLEEIEQ